jgi:probable rRNA maturation factor
MPVAIKNRQKKIKPDLHRLRRSLRRLLGALDRPVAEVSLVLTDDGQIREINRTYLKRDRPTNVISFAMQDGEYGALHPEMLGDIVISVETALRDADSAGITLMDELEFLMIHGLLHLIGYEHENTTAQERRRMQARERELFSLLRHYELA